MRSAGHGPEGVRLRKRLIVAKDSPIPQIGDCKLGATLLTPHGGDLAGFLLMHAEQSSLDSIRASKEFVRLLGRAGSVVDNVGVVFAYTGDALGQLMGIFGELSQELPLTHARGTADGAGHQEVPTFVECVVGCRSGVARGHSRPAMADRLPSAALASSSYRSPSSSKPPGDTAHQSLPETHVEVHRAPDATVEDVGSAPPEDRL
jgi:hypothetical protein